MKPRLRILSLEDDQKDVMLIQELLETEGVECELKCVETQAEFTAAVERGGIDVILADYTLPSFDGLSALKLALDKCPNVPFIFVSGTLGEEVAIEALKVGATDYVLKTRLSRLVPSMLRALREAQDRDERKRAEESLRRNEAYLAEAQRLSATGSFGWKAASGEIVWSEETYRIFALDRTTEPTLEFAVSRVHPEDRDAVQQALDRATREAKDWDLEHRIVMPGNTVKHLHVVAHAVPDELTGGIEFVGAVMDVTAAKESRQALEKAYTEIQGLRDELQKENIVLREEIDRSSIFEDIVGNSPALQKVLARVSKVAPTDSSVLITGETGTGKELVARAIHRRSNRSSRAFVSVNCAVIPRDLIASELFGHEKGAFTGATQRRLGRFELAAEGTIFLDEVGELPAETQITLLRVLQEHEFERVGGARPIQTNARLVAATNRDLQAAIAAGVFRNDLFYRLNVFPIEIPPLRERREDIPQLVDYFIHRYARKAGKSFRRIDKKSLDSLQSYPWPGNIRELQNVIERSVIVCETESFSVDESWLSGQPLGKESKTPDNLSLKIANQQKEMIEAALRESAGQVFGPNGAAAKLGMPRSTLESKIRSLKINKNRFKPGLRRRAVEIR
jgi:DNA-binding NtrC family response regulator